MDSYELALAFEKVEDQILQNLKKAFEKYIENQDISKFNKSDWHNFEVRALRGLKQFKIDNIELFRAAGPDLEKEMKQMLMDSYREELKKTNSDLEKMAKDGFIEPHSFNVNGFNSKKIKVLTKETLQKEMKAAEYAILRSTSDKYRDIIVSAHLYKQSGAATLWEAVDMATSDFCKNGITTIQYANGANVNIASYSEMAIRTADARCQNQADADCREEWDVDPLVMTSSYGACSPVCLPWQGRIYIDDVYGSPSPKMLSKTKYERLSVAIDGGLFHPNCRHTISTYYEGYSTVEKEKRSDKEISEVYKAEQQQRAIERELRKKKRLRDACLTEEEKKKYNQQIVGLNKKMNEHIKTTNKEAGKEVLRRDRAREQNRYK